MDGQNREITKVEADSRRSGRYRIHVNGEYAFTVHEDVVVKFRLIKGATLPDSLEREVLKEEEQMAAYRYAVRYIGKAMRSAKEVRDKLKEKGYSPDIVDEVLKRLNEQRFVDDAAYANALATQRLKHNKKGRLWIRHELSQKGVSKQEAERVLEQLDPQEEWEEAWHLARKRWPSIKGERADRLRKVMALLVRRGFPAEIARSVARKLREDEDAENG